MTDSAPLHIHLLGGAQVLAAALQARLAPPYTALALLPDPPAIEAAPSPVLTLLLGLEGPADTAMQARDAQCRAWLTARRRPFQVLYGPEPQRLQAALRAVAAALPGALREALPPHPGERAPRLRNWSCEKCSDPACEHRLFTALKGRAD